MQQPNSPGTVISDRSERGYSLQASSANVSTRIGDSVRPLCTSELQLLTVVEVAALLGIGRSKVYELLYAGELKSVKIGGSRRVRYTDLGDYVRYLDDAS